MQRLTLENAILVNNNDDGWKMNGAGRKYHHQYGYGTFDTWKIIEAAKTYKNVLEQTKFQVSSGNVALEIPDLSAKGVTHTISVTDVLDLGRLEHVEVTVFITHQSRGDISIHLISPSGFRSRMIESRKFDSAKTGFPGWTMMSVAHWYV